MTKTVAQLMMKVETIYEAKKSKEEQMAKLRNDHKDVKNWIDMSKSDRERRQHRATLSKIVDHARKQYGMILSEDVIDEAAVSQKQQQYFGMVHAIQKGEKVKGASAKLKKTAKEIGYSDAKDFAATSHEGLPVKVKESHDLEYFKKLAKEINESK